MDHSSEIDWVVLTTGDRPREVEAAVRSLAASTTVVVNGGSAGDAPADANEVVCPINLGIPGGRDVGVRHTHAPIVGFLDDDAVASPGIEGAIAAAFKADPRLGVVALRLIDERGETSRRHVPRFGGRGATRGGNVATFLGGACAVRRCAYEEVGGYFNDLFYSHEELELGWRLIDGGWKIRYLPDTTVFHPRTEIGRHPAGWRMTGRNRVWIARRTLPWPIAVLHGLTWLGLGVLRAPGSEQRAAYISGWRTGWVTHLDRQPIRWRSIWRLTALGRPPVL